MSDFRRKRFELCSGIGTNSRKTRNRPKKAKAHRNAEGGAAFLPRPLLPPRPHPCWRFWGFPTRRRKVREAKKRGCGRGGVGFSPALLFFIANTNRNHRSSSKRPTSASAEPVTRPRRLSVRLSHLPPSLLGDRGVLRRTDIRRARTEVSEEKRKSAASRRVHRLCTDFYEKYFLTPQKFGKICV